MRVRAGAQPDGVVRAGAGREHDAETGAVGDEVSRARPAQGRCGGEDGRGRVAEVEQQHRQRAGAVAPHGPLGDEVEDDVGVAVRFGTVRGGTVRGRGSAVEGVRERVVDTAADPRVDRVAAAR